MKRFLDCQFTLLLVVLVTQFSTSLLSSDVEAKLKFTISPKHSFGSQYTQIIKTLKECSIFDNNSYKVNGYLNSGFDGVIFDVSKDEKNYIAKVIIDDGAKYTSCNRELILYTLKSKNVMYVNQIITYDFFKSYIGRFYFYSCALILERADVDLSKKDLFTKKDKDAKIENSRKLFRFFGKVIQGFAEINFKGKVLHGDIKPANIMIKYTESKDSFDKDFEPVIIDFSLSLATTNPIDNFPRYDQGYRPPEMEEGDIKSYKYSKDFNEDFYALGKTIEQVLQYHEEFINRNQCEIYELKTLASNMTNKRDPNQATQPSLTNSFNSYYRPNMKQVLSSAISIMKECNIDNDKSVNEEFYKQASNSLKDLAKELLII